MCWFILGKCFGEFGGISEYMFVYHSWVPAGLLFPRMGYWPHGWLPSFGPLSPVCPILWFILVLVES